MACAIYIARHDNMSNVRELAVIPSSPPAACAGTGEGRQNKRTRVDL